jgi:hypothetical protein
MTPNNRRALALVLAGLTVIDLATRKRPHPLHLIGIALGLFGGFGGGPAGVGQPIRRR